MPCDRSAAPPSPSLDLTRNRQSTSPARTRYSPAIPLPNIAIDGSGSPSPPPRHSSPASASGDAEAHSSASEDPEIQMISPGRVISDLNARARRLDREIVVLKGQKTQLEIDNGHLRAENGSLNKDLHRCLKQYHTDKEQALNRQRQTESQIRQLKMEKAILQVSHDAAHILEDTLRCTICLQRLRKPRILQCSHTFCEECIFMEMHQKIANLGSAYTGTPRLTHKCAFCRSRIRVRPVRNRVLDELVASLPQSEPDDAATEHEPYLAALRQAGGDGDLIWLRMI